MMIDYAAIFVIGFLSSFGHCIGMCGGFVTAYSMRLNQEQQQNRWYVISPHILYNTGRIITYVFLGLFFGIAGEAFGLAGSIRGFQASLQLFAGIVMIIIALEMAGWLPAFNNTRFPLMTKFKSVIGQRLRGANHRNIFGLGIALGFIPCGLVYAAGAKAAVAGSIPAAMLTMAFFGLGTFPAMFALGVSVSRFSVKFRQRAFKFAAVLVIILGLFTAYRGVIAFMTPPHIHHHAEAHTDH